MCIINFVVTIANNIDNMTILGWKSRKQSLWNIIMVNNNSELRKRIAGLVPAFKSA